MRDKHLHIAADSALLRSIHRAVHEKLVMDKQGFQLILTLKLVFYPGISALAYAGLFFIDHVVLFILTYVIYGFSVLLFAFNFAHDLSHGTVFRKAPWDDLCFIFIYTLNGAHAEAWKKRHIESHHFAPNVEHYDSDLEISQLIRVVPQSAHRWYHRAQHVYAPMLYMTYSLYWVFIKDFYIFLQTPSKSWRYVISFWMQKFFYLAYLLVLPLLFSHQPWYTVVAAFVCMHLVQSLFLLFTFFMTHHVEGLEYPAVDAEGRINTSWVMNQINSSNDMYPFSETANFIFGGFNNHIAHHLFPHIHHIYYARLSRLLYEVLHQHGVVPHQTSYWGGIRAHLRWLKKMSCPADHVVYANASAD